MKPTAWLIEYDFYLQEDYYFCTVLEAVCVRD